MEAEKPTISELISLWNERQREYGIYDSSPKFIQEKTFLQAIDLRKDQQLSFADFKTILESYYKFKKVPLDKFMQVSAEIEEEIRAEEEQERERKKHKPA